MKIAFYTMGCKVNQFDTAVLCELARGREHTVVPFEREADIYVINTCSVTQRSDQEARRLIRKVKRARPGARVVVTGCYAETHPDELLKIEGVDLLLGNAEKFDLMNFIDGCGRTVGPTSHIGGLRGLDSLTQPLIREFPDHTRAFIKIQDGCDYACSFCLIPRARGAGRSLEPERVIEQVRSLEETGFGEVVLTGVNLGTYGRDFSPKRSLAEMLVLLLDRTRIPRIRLSSIEPKTWTPELIESIASSKRVCRHFHVPLQSGDDGILYEMNRHYGRRFYRDLVRSLAGRFPGAGIGADVMVGFPGEGEAEFNNTLTLLEELPMSYLHVFPYSPRPQTPAGERDDTVQNDKIEERARALRRLSLEKGEKFVRSFVGREVELLVEKERDTATGSFLGLTDNYIRAEVEGPEALKNRLVKARITGMARGRAVAVLAGNPPTGDSRERSGPPLRTVRAPGPKSRPG